MKSLSKLLGALLLGLLLLIAVAGFALTYLLDPNDYKDEIRSLVQDKTGYDLQINGDIGWSLFPWLGLELADARLARVGMSDQPFADIRLLAAAIVQRDQDRWQVSHLCVRKITRMRGVARRLLSELQREAARQGVSLSMALPRNRPELEDLAGHLGVAWPYLE